MMAQTIQCFQTPWGPRILKNSFEPIPQPLLDEKQFQNILITKDGEPDCIPLSTTIKLKCKKTHVVFPNGLWGIDYRWTN